MVTLESTGDDGRPDVRFYQNFSQSKCQKLSGFCPLRAGSLEFLHPRLDQRDHVDCGQFGFTEANTVTERDCSFGLSALDFRSSDDSNPPLADECNHIWPGT